MTTEERLAALEKSVAELQDPQRIRDSLEYTWNPRGTADEVRVQDATGALLPIRKRIQFLGGVTDDPANSRSIIPAPTGGGNLPSLVWSDDFSTDQLATAYTAVTGYTVSGGQLVHGGTSSTADLASTDLRGRDMVMQVKVNTATIVSGTTGTWVQLVARHPLDPTNVFLQVRCELKITSVNGASTLWAAYAMTGGLQGGNINNSSGFNLAGGTPIWLRMGLSSGYVFGGLFTSDPLTTAPSSTSLKITSGFDVRNIGLSSGGPAHALVYTPGLESAIASSSVTGLVLDDFKVWHT